MLPERPRAVILADLARQLGGIVGGWELTLKRDWLADPVLIPRGRKHGT